MAALYKGFTTQNWSSNKSFGLSNISLVKADLINHIYTQKGERVMMPNFGTRIPVLAFEPNDETTRQIIREDLTEVFNYDPRVKLITLNISSLTDNNAIIAEAELEYIEFKIRDVLRIEVQSSV